MTPPDSPPLLSLRQLEVGFTGRAILPPIAADLDRGTFWAIIGPNGAGKSTLVRTLLGLHPAVRGDVVRAGDLKPAYVPQQAALDPLFPIRVIDFVLMGRLQRRTLLGPARARDREAASRALAAVSASDLGGLLVRELSGGERQRVLIARALASETNFCVLDEPTAALDPASEREVLDLVASLRVSRGATVVMVTHLLDAGLARADRAMLLDADHRVALTGTPAEIRRSAAFARLSGWAPTAGEPVS